jgi:hypothetical protein
MRPKTASPVTEIVQRLDLIISLLLDRSMEGSKASMTDKIVKLTELGASPAQVGEILRRPVNYVTAATAMRKKAKNRG